MKKQWGKELRVLKKASDKVEDRLMVELKAIQRQTLKLQRAGIRSNNQAVKMRRKLDRRIAILEGRLS